MEFEDRGIFVRPRPKKSVLPPPSKKRKVDHKIAEINFDFNARSEYLTGFHKRKVQRTKQAQLEAAKKAREEKILMRKQVRQSCRNTGGIVLIRRTVTRRAEAGT